MSNHGLQFDEDSYAKSMETRRPSKSTWINHWMNTSSNPALHVHDQVSLHEERGKDLEMEQGAQIVQIDESSKHKALDINVAPGNIYECRNSWKCQRDNGFLASNSPQSMEAVQVVTEAQRVEIRYETLVTNSRNLGDARLELQPISVCNFSKKIGSIFAQKHMSVPIAVESNLRTDNISKYGTTLKPSNSNIFFETLRSAPTEAALQLKENYSQPKNSSQCRRQLVKPNISLDKSRTDYGDLGNSMHDFTSTRLLPIHSHSGRVTRLEQLNDGCQSSSGGNRPVCHIDNPRLFSSVGSILDVSIGPKFSPATDHVITSSSKGKQVSRESTISSKFTESTSQKLFTLLSDLNRGDDCNEKLQPLGSFRNTEEKRPVKNERTAFLASKNESSAETETMDINLCQTWNSFSSATSSPSFKDAVVGKTPATSHSRILREELGGKKIDIELPDMNQEPPPSLSPEQEIGNMDQSMSRTESLDVEHLHVDQAGNSNSSAQQGSTPSEDPSSRWVKRLRLSSSGYHVRGTKNVKMEDPTCTTKVDKLHTRTYSNKNNLRLISGVGEEVGPKKLGNTLLSLENNKLASTDSTEECWRLNLSHPWIQRWCHNQAPQSQAKTLEPVACELNNSKAALDEYQTRQFPSIAAMALMGKTMNGLQACKFRNKGSFVVWGTDEFGAHLSAPRRAGDR